MEYLVDIKSFGGSPVNFKVGAGEIVYSLSSERKKELLKSLVLDSDLDLQGKVLNVEVHQNMNAEKLKSLRSEIGYIHEDMYLSRSQSIWDNFQLYVSGKKKKSVMNSELEKHLEHFKINKEDKAGILSPSKSFLTKLSFCLAKQPQLVIIPKTFSMASRSLFTTHMAYIYDLVMNTGMAYIASVGDIDLTKNYPGRMLSD